MSTTAMRGNTSRQSNLKGFCNLATILGLFNCLGCDGRPSSPPTRTWTKPCDICIAGVENFAKVSPTLWRCAQPTADEFRNLVAQNAHK